MSDQESKMNDRFGVPLRVGDRVVWISPPHTEQAVLLGTVEKWIDTLVGFGVQVRFSDRSWVVVLRGSEDRLIRWGGENPKPKITDLDVWAQGYWPLGDGRAGAHVLVPSSHLSHNWRPLWAEICWWLGQTDCSLVDIQTYWFDSFGSLELRIEGMPHGS
jgi:hypothetical protein